MDKIISFIKKQPKWILFLVFFGIFNDLVTTISLNALSSDMAQNVINSYVPIGSISPEDLAQLNKRNSIGSSVILVIFLGWDFAAYISLLFRRNWGRKFIQAIALCGLILTGGIIYAQITGKLPAGISTFSLYFNYLSLPFYIWAFIVLMKNRNLFIGRKETLKDDEVDAPQKIIQKE